MVLDVAYSVIAYFSSRIFIPLVQGIAGVVPKVLAGILFLGVAYLGIKIILSVVEKGLLQAIESSAIVNLKLTILKVFLWFSTFLMLLSILGLDEIAASLGTAAGFIGLGISFALKDMIADTVAGVYLIRDSDFKVGDSVESGGVEGTVKQIDIRKTRFKLENGDTTVIANKEVEKKWTTKKSE